MAARLQGRGRQELDRHAAAGSGRRRPQKVGIAAQEGRQAHAETAPARHLGLDLAHGARSRRRTSPASGHVGLRAGAAEVVQDRRQAVRWRLGDPHVARDDGVVDAVAKKASHIRRDLLREVVAAIEHGQHHALDLEPGIQAAPHAIDGAQQQAQALEGEELALQRHEHRARRRQGVDRQQPERGRTVDQDIVVVLVEAAQRILERELAARALDQLDLRRRQVDHGGYHLEARDAGAEHGVAELGPAQHDVVGGDLAIAVLDAEPGARIALGVEVDHQDGLAAGGERGAEVDRRGGLADAALLVGDRDHPAELRLATIDDQTHGQLPRASRGRPSTRTGSARSRRAYASFAAPGSIHRGRTRP